MGFYNGRVTFLRFQVSGPAPRLFDAEHLDRLADRAAGRQRLAAADGVETGWTAGDHVLDTDFLLDKNVINDTLHFELRVDVDKLPADLMRAYTAVELKALSKNNPSGTASARQKREAKEAARDRLEDEAKDGRYRKRKCFPVLWDRLSNEVLFGATSLTQVDRLCSLFEQTFQLKLEAVTAGRRAYLLSELHNRTRQVDDSAPSAFVPGGTADVAWIADESSRDFLGNEFLLWLWYYTDIESDTLKLADDSDATVMIARSLTLECPRGQTGHETISHEGPTRLAEARRAIQTGKLPRKCGLTLVRHDQQYELAIHAETLAVSSAKIPPPPEDVTDARAKLDERATQLRALVETLDLVYDVFCSRRFGKAWEEDLPGMQRWLKREERRAA
ncbi:hypothetical protein [Urbifossiella limnaea]|uniref:Recombination-associated protein RdgC n=1 Tax=Urbifossiella limnaea TaxID=2528023 RepID=A0A517XVM2_9BACT|nr:hypothetical protein [Urbifossiella limnaea]QDU21560.1 hypothetical protein ETAA1_35290 [Urbifossiella limnaea]